MGIRPAEYAPLRTRELLNSLPNPSDRKLRLFMIECHRRAADVCDQPELHPVLEFFSEHVDGKRSSSELFAFIENAGAKHKSFLFELCRAGGHSIAREVLTDTAELVVTELAKRRYPDLEFGTPDYWPKKCEVMRQEDAVRLSWMLDIWGNPDGFREPTFSRWWRTTDAIGLAQGIYDERAFDRLPVLADALMDAGCEDEQVIAHCRIEASHVRGCWVVDLVLGRK
jgi:hypothetical protein